MVLTFCPDEDRLLSCYFLNCCKEENRSPDHLSVITSSNQQSSLDGASVQTELLSGGVLRLWGSSEGSSGASCRSVSYRTSDGGSHLTDWRPKKTLQRMITPDERKGRPMEL